MAQAPKNVSILPASRDLVSKTGAVRSLDPREMIAAATAAAARFSDEFHHHMTAICISLVATAAEADSDADLASIRRMAHDLRGMGGHCGCPAASAAAGGLVDYLTELASRPTLAPDLGLVRAHARLINLLTKERTSLVEAQAALNELAEAVDRALAR